MIRHTTPLAALLCGLLILAASPASAAEAPCEKTHRYECFGVASASASLSTYQAGAHPDFTVDVQIAKDSEGKPYANTRNIRIETPPGLIGDPNVLGIPQQCTTAELFTWGEPSGGCPVGSQVGVTRVELSQGAFTEPVYMMTPPGGEVVAQLGIIAGVYPTLVNLRVRSESDYGLTAEVVNAAPAALVSRLKTTFWGVPADPVHDTEHCTPFEVEAQNCVVSLPPTALRPLPFLTNPTRCGPIPDLRASASSWVESGRFDTKAASFPEGITGCNKLPYGPALTVNPTNHHTSSPTGLDLTIQLPASQGVKVLEPAQTRDIRIDLPEGIAVNPGSADGLGVCSVEQVHFKENLASECPDAAKMAATEFEVGGLPRRLKGAIYLREPEPGNLFRIWVVADDLGAHVKLPGQLEVDKTTGQIDSVVLENPQVPLREVKLLFKSGFRAPLMTPHTCGKYLTHYEFTSWAGGPPAKGDVPMEINEGCDGGGFSPKLSAGSTNAQGGAFSPFTFTIGREDSEENIGGLNVTLPKGIAASFVGIPRCEGADAETGHCPAASRIGKTAVADGAGPNPLWVPQPGKDPTAVYLSGPYKGAPLSIVAVVPAQAGPFDLGLEVVRSAVYVDPVTAQVTAKADPLPQFIEGIPVTYRTVHVDIDRAGFALNPTSCGAKQTEATVISTQGAVARPSSSYQAVNCAKLGFSPRLSIDLKGGTRRGSFPKLEAKLKMPAGGANIAAAQVTLPHSEFIENAHFKTICTRVQFASHACPAGSIYGIAVVRTPLLEQPLEGPVYLRSSSHELPDLVMALKGPPSLPIEIDAVGRVNSANGGLRTTFESIPDAPVSEFTLKLQGGKKGLIVNSTNLCVGTHRAKAIFNGQNGKTATLHPALKASCGNRGHKKRPSR